MSERAPDLPFEYRYELPQLSLLAEPRKQIDVGASREALKQNARLLEGVLEDFGVHGKIINVCPGPIVTLYEFEPAAGIEATRVIGLADDIARSMSVVSARVALMPGLEDIGIELPNAVPEMVYLREFLASENFEKSKFKLTLALGKRIGGDPMITPLDKMPHLLVVGTTGSGKSTAIDTMILSLLYRLKPEECRMIMIDHMMLQLSVYEGIPHLLAPVISDMKEAVLALNWTVSEMEGRCRKMTALGVRNIEDYNQCVFKARSGRGKPAVGVDCDGATGPELDGQEALELSPMPHIVVIVDEIADLMLVKGINFKMPILRLAQKAGSVGIHLIMATQRPSIDVIADAILESFTIRLSFQLCTRTDSCVVLGEPGAEQLLGQGDALLRSAGFLSRLHGPFVSDEEVECVVRHLKAQGKPDYLDAVLASDEGEDEDEEANFWFEGGDELYAQALEVVMRDRRCSVSHIQRSLDIGYNRASWAVERMEKEGIVGPANHAGKREILVYSRDVRNSEEESGEEEE